MMIEGGIVAIEHGPPNLCWEGEPAAGEEATQVFLFTNFSQNDSFECLFSSKICSQSDSFE